MQYNEINNSIVIHGKLIGPAKFSHQIYNDTFYNLCLKCKRLSGTYDIIPITMTKNILDSITVNDNFYYMIKGQIRSYNRFIDNKNRLIITVYVKSIQQSHQLEKEGLNSVNLNGYICKKPNYRKTPFLREICDVLLAVNRAHGKSDYIPIIAWGQTARSVSNYPIGKRLRL